MLPTMRVLLQNGSGGFNRFGRTGQLGDDIGMQQTIMMSVDLWRTWLKPRLAEVIRAGRRIKPDLIIFYHSCGYVLPVLATPLIRIAGDPLRVSACQPFYYKTITNAQTRIWEFDHGEI